MATKLQNILESNAESVKNYTILISLIIISVLFVICLISCILKKNYTLRKRVWYFSSNCGIIILGFTFSVSEIYLAISIALTLTYFGIIFSLQEKKENKNELDEFIDQQIELPIPLEQRDKVFRVEEEKLKASPVQEKSKTQEIDFSHVKSIIERISLLSLTQADRKTVKELEFSVISAENGDDRIETKQKINDGLGALLKIMSKYGA